MANTKMESHMRKAFIHGLTVKSTMENGLLVSNKAMECGEVAIKLSRTLVNGLTVKRKVMEFMFGQMVISLKVSGTKI